MEPFTHRGRHSHAGEIQREQLFDNLIAHVRTKEQTCTGFNVYLHMAPEMSEAPRFSPNNSVLWLIPYLCCIHYFISLLSFFFLLPKEELDARLIWVWFLIFPLLFLFYLILSFTLPSIEVLVVHYIDLIFISIPPPALFLPLFCSSEWPFCPLLSFHLSYSCLLSPSCRWLIIFIHIVWQNTGRGPRPSVKEARLTPAQFT